MTWKTTMLDLPLVGAEGGSICNLKSLSMGELERLNRSAIRQVERMIGLGKDFSVPDVYTTPQIRARNADEFTFLQC